jgi:hypothetical protein
VDSRRGDAQTRARRTLPVNGFDVIRRRGVAPTALSDLAARDLFGCEVSDGRSSFLRISSMRSSDGGHGPIACLNADVATSGPDIRRPRSLTARCLRESGWLMTTAVSRLTAHPLHAAVALARFGVPDGYVAPHDSPAAYARAVKAARSHCRDVGTADTRRQTSRG